MKTNIVELSSIEQQGEIPRAERFPTDGELLYSEVARLARHAGSLVNVSRSGLLVEGRHPIQAGTAIEMTFTLRAESLATRQSRFIARAW